MVLVCVGLGFGPAHANDLYWDGNGVTAGTGGTGNWFIGGSPSLWRDGSPGGALVTWSQNPTFFEGTAGTVTLTQDIAVNNQLVIQTGGYIFQGNASNRTLTLKEFGGAPFSFSLDSADNSLMTVGSLTAGQELTVSGTNNGSVHTFSIGAGDSVQFLNALTNMALTKVGTGEVILSGNNTYTGATVVSAGVLDIRHANALGTTANGTTVSSGAALEIQGGIAVGAEALSLNGTGISSDGALRNISGGNSYAGAITINSTTRINSDSGTLTLDVASGNAITGSNDSLQFGGAGNITVNDAIATGTGGLTKDGAGTLILSGANTYTGVTTINGGVLEANTLANGGANSSIGAAGTGAANLVINGGTLKYTGSGHSTNRNYTIGVNGATFDASGTGAMNFTSTTGVTYAGTGSRTFTLTGTNTGANTLRGGIGDPTGGSTSLVKNGSGSWTIAGQSGYTGTTTINNGVLTVDDGASTAGALSATTAITVNSGGTLALSGEASITNRLNTSATMTLNGGTFNTGGLSERNVSGPNVIPGIGALTLQSSSVIDLASGASILAFANSSASTWSGTLSIYNWSGSLAGNGTDQLYFGTDTSGLTGTQLSQVSFYSDSGTTFLGTATFAPDLDGEIVPVPEPSTWLAAALVCCTIVWTQRGRFGTLLGRFAN